jgi:hypothetical protein
VGGCRKRIAPQVTRTAITSAVKKNAEKKQNEM